MDLRLISASSGAGEPAGCVLMYRLDGEGSPHGLPVVGETYPWAGKTICALRDRHMIEWVISFPEAKRLFDRMVKEITTALRNCQCSGRKSKVKPSVHVGVVCSNGAQLSPCFVEKLYEHFSYDMEGLEVSRDHRDAMRGTWGRCKDFVWQVSCITVHSQIRSSEVFSLTTWLNFDPTANSESERQFRKNPLLSRLQFTDMVLDFEGGTAYSSQRQQTYYIRCTHILPSKISCWILTDAGYRTASQSFHAAGIQPYSVHPVTGEAVFLLGRITYSTCDWCDFGGLKSSRLRRERPRWTAARECAEETLEILGTSAKLASALKDYKTNNCFKILNVDTQYVGHFLRIPYRDYPTIFEEVLREKGDCVIEVDEMRWFPLSSMKSAVKMAHADSQRRIAVKALQQDGSVDGSCLHKLREPFVGTLCIADALNVLDSIAAIASNIHRKQDPSGTTLPQACTPEPRELQSEAMASVPLASDSPASLEQLVARAALDGTSESNSSESEDEHSAAWDSSSSGSRHSTSSKGQLMGSSSHSGLNSELEASELSETNQVFETAADIDGSTLQGEQSVLSHVKGKFVNLAGSFSRQKKQRTDHCQRTKHRGKGSKKKHKQLSLYGMWAGSFPIGEMYMNS